MTLAHATVSPTGNVITLHSSASVQLTVLGFYAAEHARHAGRVAVFRLLVQVLRYVIFLFYYVTKLRIGGEALACFFFQAEDGIRDYKVTGVQTCALPI